MKKFLYFPFLSIFILSIILLAGCENNCDCCDCPDPFGPEESECKAGECNDDDCEDQECSEDGVCGRAGELSSVAHTMNTEHMELRRLVLDETEMAMWFLPIAGGSTSCQATCSQKYPSCSFWQDPLGKKINNYNWCMNACAFLKEKGCASLFNRCTTLKDAVNRGCAATGTKKAIEMCMLLYHAHC